MSNTKAISPFVPKYKETSGKSALASLAQQNMLRIPGTGMLLQPHREASGAYRTGLDKNAIYIKQMSKDAAETEVAYIDSLLEKLNSYSGYQGVDFGPMSKVWNVWSDSPVKANFKKLGNETIYLDLNNPQDLLDYCWLRVNPQIAKSRLAIEKGECPYCQYYLVDETVETSLAYKKKVEINKAIAKLNSFSPTELKRMARLLGFPVTSSTTEERAYNLIDDLLKKSEFDSGEYKGRNTITVFNELSELNNDELEIRDLIKSAIRHNIYRTKGEEIMQGSNLVATSESALVKVLISPDGQQDLMALKARVAQKTQND